MAEKTKINFSKRRQIAIFLVPCSLVNKTLNPKNCKTLNPKNSKTLNPENRETLNPGKAFNVPATHHPTATDLRPSKFWGAVTALPI